MAQIYIKTGKTEEALELLTKATDIQENGDNYYLMAKIFQIDDELDSYKDCLELALENRKSLTFNFEAVKQELSEAKKNISKS